MKLIGPQRLRQPRIDRFGWKVHLEWGKGGQRHVESTLFQMGTEAEAKDQHATMAAVERLWSHMVGIANAADPSIGTDPISGLPAREQEIPGTSVAGNWGEHTFLLTAKHVLDKAELADLSFFVRPTGSFTTASSTRFEDGLVPVRLQDSSATIRRCGWEDLAIVVLSPNSLGAYLEFADLTTNCAEPSEGDTVIGLGFPVSTGLMFERRVGSNFQRAILLNPTGFSGEVLPSSTGKYFRDFDSEKHYLIPFELSKQGKHPRGISGAAVWLQSKDKQIVWTPKFSFSGICTSCYKDGSIEQIVKSAVVQRFLTDEFGLPT